MAARRSALPLAGAGLVLALTVSGAAPAQNATAPALPVSAPSAELSGQRLFLRCASCHAIAATAPAKIGPTLRGVVGRRAGSQAGYAYSPAMKAKTFAWDEATLDRWLTRPSAVVPGTSMAFAGLARPEDRRAVIAYLKKNS